MAYRFDHFDGTALPAGWSALTAGTGSIVVADSKATGTLVASGDAAAIYTPFDPTLDQSIVVCGRIAASGVAPYPALQLHHKASAPVADTRANLRNLFKFPVHTVSAKDYTRMLYVDTGGTNRNWAFGSNSWTTGATIISTSGPTPRDDYRIMGIEWSATRQQMRMFVQHVADGSAENADYGLRLAGLTDWLALSSIRDGASSTLWLVVGYPETDAFSSGAFEVEWVAHAWGAALPFAANNKATVGSTYNITSYSSYDLRTQGALPIVRGAIAIGKGTAGQWDDRQVQFGSGFRDDDGVYVMSYSGNRTAGATLCGLATAPAPEGPWTKLGVILPTASPGDPWEGTINDNQVTKDWSEPDPARRYKLLVRGYDAALSNPKNLLFDAATRAGPYIYRGVFLADDGTETNVNPHGHPIWYKGRWHWLYACDVAGVTVLRYATSKRIAVGALVKGGVTLATQAANSAESDVTAVSGRTITLVSTSGFVRDAVVIGTNTSAADNYATSRVRTVLSGTQLELYHAMPGLTNTSHLRTLNRGADFAAPQLIRLGDKWCVIGNPFRVFTSHPTLNAHVEATALFVGGTTPYGNPVIDWTATLIAPWGRDAWNTTISVENIRTLLPVANFSPPTSQLRRRRSPPLRR